MYAAPRKAVFALRILPAPSSITSLWCEGTAQFSAQELKSSRTTTLAQPCSLSNRGTLPTSPTIPSALEKQLPFQPSPQYLDFLSQGVPPLPEQPPARQAVPVVGEVGLVTAAHVDGDHHLGPHGPGHVSWGDRRCQSPLPSLLLLPPGAHTELYGCPGVTPTVSRWTGVPISAHPCRHPKASWMWGHRDSAGEWLDSVLEGPSQFCDPI